MSTELVTPVTGIILNYGGSGNSCNITLEPAHSIIKRSWIGILPGAAVQVLYFHSVL